MQVAVEEKNKKALLDYLEQFISRDFSEVVFTLPPAEHMVRYSSPRFRLILVAENWHSYQILKKNGFEDARLTPDKVLFCQRYGFIKNCFYEENWETFAISFWPEYIRFVRMQYTGKTNFWRHTWYHSHHAINQSGIYILKAIDELALIPESNQQACFLMQALLQACYDNLVTQKQPASNKSLRTYQNIKAYLYENFDENINRESVAKTFKVSPSHISKLFAAYSENNFNTELKNLRLEYAKKLLENTDFSIAEVAEQSGFINTGYFIKAFRLFYGETPGVYRRQNIHGS